MRELFNKLRASVSTEVAVSIALSAVVLIVVLGMFSDNIKTMVLNSSISDIFSGNASKTLYSSFNRDYTDAEVETQVTGEQGLQMLRKIANNKSIEKISEEFSGVDTSVKNQNSIGYLALIIESIVGSPDICVNMKKNSDKFCHEDNLGGYQYRLKVSSTSVKISDVNTNETIIISPASAILSGSKIAKTSDGRSNFSQKQKFDFAKLLTQKVKDLIYSNVLLVNTFETFKTEEASDELTSTELIEKLNQLTVQARASADEDYEKCSGLVGAVRCIGQTTIGESDRNKIRDWQNQWNSTSQQLANRGNSPDNASNYNNGSIQSVASHYSNLLKSYNVFEILDDNAPRNNPSACKVLQSGLKTLSPFANQSFQDCK